MFLTLFTAALAAATVPTTPAGVPMTVGVNVGTAGPYRFLVDTGADRSAVTRELAARLSLPASGAANMHSLTGLTTVQTASVKGLHIEGRALPEIEAPLLEAASVGADGILGTDVLRSSLVRFDFRRKTLSIFSPQQRRKLLDQPDTIVVTGQRRDGRLIITQAQLDGQRLTVVLDTGSEISIGNAALHDALAQRRRLSSDEPITLISVTGAALPATHTIVRRLELGGLTLTGLGIAFADAHTFKALQLDDRPALLLGMDALRAFDSVTIDLPAKKLRFAIKPETIQAAFDGMQWERNWF
jgi:predicted aspartyl protease